MNEPWLLALMLTAATVGSLHSLAPDHWVPFAALSRANRWSALRTARLAFICGLGHVTVSALLGILAVLLGREAVEGFGTTLHDSAPFLLIAFGFVYMVWGLWRVSRRRLLHHADHLDGVEHAHGHGHARHHDHGGKKASEWGLFLLFCADPCIALIPMIIAAAAGGWGAITAVVIVYEIATIAAIIVLVHTASAGARKVRLAWLDRYSEAIAGAMILATGTLVTVLGI
jgi:nickel/cobalt exporter